MRGIYEVRRQERYVKLSQTIKYKEMRMMQRYKNTSGRQLIYDSYNTLLKSWKTDFEELDIETSYGQTHIIVAGDPQRPPLLFFMVLLTIQP